MPEYRQKNKVNERKSIDNNVKHSVKLQLLDEILFNNVQNFIAPSTSPLLINEI